MDANTQPEERVGARDERLTSVTARLLQVAATRDPSSVLGPEALGDAERLAELLRVDDGDLQARFALGWLYWYRHLARPQRERRDDLGRALDMFVPCFIAGVASAELPGPLLPVLADLATPVADGLLDRAMSSAEVDLLSAAAVLWQRIVAATPAGDPDRVRALARLGSALHIRFERSGARADIDAAIEAVQAAVAAGPADRPDRVVVHAILVAALRARFEHGGPRSDIDTAIEMGLAVLATTSPDDLQTAAMLVNVSEALRLRFVLDGNLADIDAAVKLGQTALETIPAGDPTAATFASSLSNALVARFQHLGASADIDAAIALSRTAVEEGPADDPDRGANLNGFGIALMIRFRNQGIDADVDAAIQALRAAVRTTPVGHVYHAMYLANLGNALQSRYEHTGDLPDLNAAIENIGAAVAASAANHAARGNYLSVLGNALRLRYERTGVLTDVDAAINLSRQAVDVTPGNHADRAMYLANLGACYQARFVGMGATGDLDAAIEFGRAAVDAANADHTDRPGYLSNVGNAYRLRFDRTGALPDLDAAIRFAREAVAASASHHPHRARYHSNLALCLQDRFERTGTLADLDLAIHTHRQALAATPADHPDRPRELTNLGGALQNRFTRIGALNDLDAAIRSMREAVAATPRGHPSWAMRSNGLGLALLARHGRTGSPDDLDAAIQAMQSAISIIPAGHPKRAWMLNGLALARRSRFERTRAASDLDAAIEFGQTALINTPAGSTVHQNYLSNLGNALRGRFEHSGSLADINRAVQLISAAVAAAPNGSPDAATYLSSLAWALTARYERYRSHADLEAALSACERALAIGTAAPSIRLNVARRTAALIAPFDTGRSANLLEAAVRLLPEVAPHRLARHDQQYAMSGLSGLAADAAAMALADARIPEVARATRALRLLETGRAVLLGQAVDARSDLTDLRQHHPVLAARFVELRDQLDQHDAVAPDRHRLANDLADTTVGIRALPGFASFALPPTIEELLAQATDGPVVVLNVSVHRSDALLVTREGIRALALPGLGRAEVVSQIRAFHSALITAREAEAGADRKAAQATIHEILQWLWDTITEPVLETLGFHNRPAAGASWPRIWWAPGGLLGMLPVHAAGHHLDAAEYHPRTVLDRVVSSYTPTVRALRYARQHQRASARGHALIVAMPTTPGVPGRLPHILSEASRVREHLPESIMLTEPDSAYDDAVAGSARLPTKANVMAYLSDCLIAHFACHGQGDFVNPSRGRLLLRDHQEDPLTIGTLAAVKLEHPQLAFLSACHTAILATADLIDEAIHLTTAFQLVGFPHVIGTLWAIDDAVAADVADAFYAGMVGGAGRPDTSRAAGALHDAVRKVRDQFPRTPSLWAGYLHVGC